MEYVHDRPLSLQVYKTAAEFKAHRLNRTEQCRLNTERSHIARQERIFQKEFKSARTKLESRWTLHPVSARPRLSSDGSLVWPACRGSTRPATSGLSTRGGTLLCPSSSRDDFWFCEGATPGVVDACTGDESLNPEVTMTMKNEKDEDAIEDFSDNYNPGHGKVSFVLARKSGTATMADDVDPYQSTANEEHSTAEERETTAAWMEDGQRHSKKTVIPTENGGDSLSQGSSVPDTHPATNRDPDCGHAEAPAETKDYGYARKAKGTRSYPDEAENFDTDQPQKRGSSMESGHTTSSLGRLTTNPVERPLQSRTENPEALTPPKAEPEEQNGDEASTKPSPDVGGAPRSPGKSGRLQSRVDRFLQQQREFNKRFPLRGHQVTSLKCVRPDLLRTAHPFDPVQHPPTDRKALIIAEVLDRLGLEQNEME